jgi:hypothetical protein
VLDTLMRHPVYLVMTLFTIILMNDVAAVLATNVDSQRKARLGLPKWHPPPARAGLSLLPETSAGESEGGAADRFVVPDDPSVGDGGNTTHRALERDGRGLARDTVFFMGYQGVIAGVLYLLPESETKWTAEQRDASLRRWWENVQYPHWDKDKWYINYIGHPYFGAIAYTRARERRFGPFGGFWYAALLSGLFEFGIEAVFERPSYQDLIVTPVAGLLIGAMLFEPIRDRIRGKPELHWYDHLTLTLTDPLGTANNFLEKSLGLQADIQVQFQLPAFTSHMEYNEPTARPLNRQQNHHRWSLGLGIEWTF